MVTCKHEEMLSIKSCFYEFMRSFFYAVMFACKHDCMKERNNLAPIPAVVRD